jgi:formylglycine-generating enzyme required for sulfatase activity
MLRKLLFLIPVAGLSSALMIAMADEPKTAPKPKTEHQNYTETIKDPAGDVKFDMIAIPGGTFTMGSPEGEKGREKNEGPQLKVKVNPFWMQKVEVTWDEYDVYFKRNNANLKKEGEDEIDPKNPDAKTKPTSPYVDETYNHERDKHPAICMTHHAAMKYCEWLSAKTGKLYRLPTEAEWEYACRAGSETPYGIPDGSKLEDYAWYAVNAKDETHPRGTTHEVGSKKPNAWGLYDMHGNVMEWTLDHYVVNAYEIFAKKANGGLLELPFFRSGDKKWFHVARGGHFKDTEKDLRSAARRGSEKKWMKDDPQIPQSIWWLTNYDTIGFRVVRAVEEYPAMKGIKATLDRENDEIFKP